ncbi:hypothetical protein [uncultured Sunxiuqinia sp.]|uniref:hypothetical protein n=1 Tax=Sunxiuqinia rutila TaxID=1397841 RepID=UPI00262E579B|nr:hypothetical protein [uncultured Sunxiuqinia sp.]
MKKTINRLSGFIVALFPLVIAAVISFFLYNEWPNMLGIVLSLLLVSAACWAGYSIYVKVQRNGIIDFLTVVNASPDLDNLEPTADSQTKQRSPQELVDLWDQGLNVFKGGTIRIFGDWFGAPYEYPVKINAVGYDNFSKTMTLSFDKGIQIRLREPGAILESRSFLRILSASDVYLEFQDNTNEQDEPGTYFKSYKVENNEVKASTSIGGEQARMEASIGHDALIVYR